MPKGWAKPHCTYTVPHELHRGDTALSMHQQDGILVPLLQQVPRILHKREPSAYRQGPMTCL